MTETLSIGPWVFNPSTGHLSQDGLPPRRLEHRAAALLHFLYRHRSELVLHSDIIENVWDGRSISSNSIAVVVANIRRELGDDARNPQFIETLPKRGYRLMAPLSIQKEAAVTTLSGAAWLQKNQRNFWLAGVILVVAIVAAFTFASKQDVSPALRPSVAVTPVENLTGNAEYLALSQALSELVITEIMRTNRFKFMPQQGADYELDSRLILWNGHAALSLKLHRNADQSVVWSGMASGPEARLPAQVRREIAGIAGES